MRSSYFVRFALTVVVLVAALLLFGCSGSSTPTSTASMADQLNAVLKPIPGEGIAVDPAQAETDQTQYLVDRLQAAKDTNPDLFEGIAYETNVNGNGDYGYTFRDGSRMVWISKAGSGSTQRVLDRVEITHP